MQSKTKATPTDSVQVCQSCKSQFTIEPEDFIFYKKFGVPTPKMCPPCRAQRRLAFRNERAFYKRACDRCKKEVVSMYSPNKPYTVWCYDCWFSDDWDASSYAIDYDPERSFLDQFKELWEKVPKVALMHVRSVNSDYVNISADNKNSYLLIESSNNEDCIHGYWLQVSKDCVDVSFSYETERSYESDGCYNCYQVLCSRECHDTRESYFLYNCRGSSNCIGSVNLRNKSYCIFNKPYPKEEYFQRLKEMRLDTYSGVEKLRKQFNEFLLAQPRKYAEIVNAPGSTGNYIKDAKNCKVCFHCFDAEDSKFGVHVWRNGKDCMDVDTAGRGASSIYNSMNAGIDVSNHICTSLSWSSSFLEYSYYCFNCNSCFGSVGLRKKNFCILNKQYSKEEFETLKDQIVADMKRRGEYGEFFPASFSAFGYNESAAQEQFPLDRNSAIERGFKWEDAERGTYGKGTLAWEEVPDSIYDFNPEDITKEIFSCVTCKKNYRIIQAEFSFYKKLGIPIPRLCPDCRHTRRFQTRGPNWLWHRRCMCGAQTNNSQLETHDKYVNVAEHPHGSDHCPNEFETSYPPERPEIVYCEACYQNEVV